MTSESSVEQVLAGVRKAETLYHRLVIVASDGPGRTPALREVAVRTGARVLNLNLEIARRLLDVPARKRPLALPDVLEDAVGGHEIVLLDHLEILFDPALGQDPLRLLQGAARTRTVVAAWPGAADDGFLRYAAPNHPEHRRYPRGDLPIVGPAGAAGRPHGAPSGVEGIVCNSCRVEGAAGRPRGAPSGELRGAGRGDGAPERATREPR